MQITFAHVCDHALVDRGGKLSVIGIFSVIKAPKVPVVHSALFLAFELEFNYAETGNAGDLRIDIVDDHGKLVGRVEANIEFKREAKMGEQPRIAQVLAFRQLAFQRFGMHDINFFWHGELKKQISFEVRKIAQKLDVPPKSVE